MVAENVERAFMGDSPTLTTVRLAYSNAIAEVWIMAQIENLNEFCGVNQKMEPLQMENVSRLILIEYHYLKVSELMLFFHRFKCGKYGEFFGVVDPQKLMTALNNFNKDRISEISKYENERKKQELNRLRDEWRNSKTAISYEEYLKTKDSTPNPYNR